MVIEIDNLSSLISLSKSVRDRRKKLNNIERMELSQKMLKRGSSLWRIEQMIEDLDMEKLDALLDKIAETGVRPAVVGTNKISNINKVFYLFWKQNKNSIKIDDIKNYFKWKPTTMAQMRNVILGFNLATIREKTISLTKIGKQFVGGGDYKNWRGGRSSPELSIPQKRIIYELLAISTYNNMNPITMHILCTMRFCCNYYSQGGIRPTKRDSRLEFGDLFMINKFFYTNYSQKNQMTVSANNIIIFGTNYCEELGLIFPIRKSGKSITLWSPTELGIELIEEVMRKKNGLSN